MTETYTVTLKTDARQVDFKMTCDPDYVADVNTKIAAAYGCEPEVAHLMMRVLSPDDFVVDAGANVGFFTILAAKLVPHGRVHAFEPHPENLKRLHRNVSANALSNVTISEAALWDCRRDLALYTCPEPGMHSLANFAECTGSRTVLAMPLDEMIDEIPRLIKLDVEGAEVAAIKGAAKWLSLKTPFIVAELNQIALARFGESEKTLRDLMAGYGYHTFVPQPSGDLPVFVPPRTRLKTVKQNTMVLFSTADAVAEAWPEVTIDA